MKFEMEKIDVAFIQRRVREEEAKTGRRCLRVKLTMPEWQEFMVTSANKYMYDCNPRMRPSDWRYIIGMCRPIQYSKPTDPIEPYVNTVEVVVDC